MENLDTSLSPYFQLYGSGTYFYTNSESEYTGLTSLGYYLQGIAFQCYLTNQPPGTVPFYRMLLTNTSVHFYTAIAEEYQAALKKGYHVEGYTAYVYPTQAAGTVPLYSLMKGNDSYYTTSEPEKDMALALGFSLRGTGVNCYVYPPKKIPVYRLLIGKNYFYTPSAIETMNHIQDKTNPAGYQGIVFAVFPTQQEGTIPLTRMYKNPDHCFASSQAEVKSAAAQGYAFEGGIGGIGVIGYVYATAQGDTEPALYELKNDAGHFYTTSGVESDLFENQGFASKETMCYVLVGEFSSTFEAEVAQAKVNLAKMQQFNNDLKSSGNGLFQNLDTKMSGSSGGDPGLGVALKLAEAGFSKIGSLAGPVGSAVASIFNGLLSSWLTATPQALKDAGSPVERFDNTCTQLNATLLYLQSGIYGSWNFQFKFQGQVSTLDKLATSNFLKDVNKYTSVMNASLHALDLVIWKNYLVANYRVGKPWQVEWGFSQNYDLTPEVQKEIAARPALYCTWKFDRFLPAWFIRHVVLYKTGDIDLYTAACEYLFIDSTDGAVINPDGLYHRKDVFTTLGIPVDH